MRVIALLSLLVTPLAGCLAMDETREDAREVPVQAFVKGMTPDDVRPSVVEVPASIYEPEGAVEEQTVVTAPDGNETVTTMQGTVTQDPDGRRGVVVDSVQVTQELLPGQTWPVDALVGQINGKPLYAAEFLATREERIRRVVAGSDRAAAYRELLRILDEAFEQFVNNQLVISEAEGAIPDEAKEGLLAWMRQLQEQEIATRGGTRSEAQRSIEEEFPGTTIEEFIQRQKNEILAADLMRRRIRPRAIVSWRDVERLYMKDYERYNPLPTLRVGRIAVLATDSAKVQQVKDAFAAGKGFAEVAAELQLPDGGLWRDIKLGPGGIDGVPDLVDDMKLRLKGLREGAVDGPVEQRSLITWMTLLPGQQAPAVSIFDPMLQLRLRKQLEGERFGMEQYRYLQGLRSRWIAEDLSQMKARLIQFALERYWRTAMP
ncbi:MAG: hypothetical protein ACO32J_08535 [Phycisphaerales bacterium]